MHRADVQLLYAYDRWASARVLRAAEQVSPDQFTAPARASQGSLRGALVHILATATLWRLRCTGTSPTTMLAEAAFPTIESLVVRWHEEEAALQAYLAGLQNPDLRRPVHYLTTQGAAHATTLWHILLHVANHSTQFRGEAGMLLTEYGHSPGDLDLILFLRTQPQPGP
ncbi:MAG TPA: DinB family protein [Chloroflexia bacterium]|nr:DinB family protein [Chloroflexia bacterium]